jgi:hypothetical protein
MRWFKHLSAASDDEKLAELIDKHGAEGYGCYWLIMEKIAAKMEKGCDKTNCRYPAKKWADICGKNPRGMRRIYETFEYLSLFIFKRYGKHMDIISNSYQYELDNNCITYEYHIDIDCPNLLKYRDEYSKKSGQTPDNIPTNSGQTPDQDTETESESELDVNKKLFVEKAFEKWWPTFPKRNGRRLHKKKAKEKFKKIDQKKWPDLKTATENYTAYLKESGLSACDPHRFLADTWIEYLKPAEKEPDSQEDDGSARARRKLERTQRLMEENEQ